ncbi:MAG: hypothetical protein ACREEM_33825, partial [Blastocatellia bacterium]
MRKGSAYEDELTRIPPAEAGGWFTPGLQDKLRINKSHQRELVDGSRPAYKTNCASTNPTSGSWWIIHARPTRQTAHQQIPPAEAGGWFTPGLQDKLRINKSHQRKLVDYS